MRKYLFHILILYFSCNNLSIVPDDFNFSYSFDNTESFSSFDSAYSRTLMVDNMLLDTVLNVILTVSEMKNIFTVMEDNDIMNLPTYYERDTMQVCVVPSSTDQLIVQINGIKKKIEYSYACKPKNIILSEKYLKIAKAIRTVIDGRKEIQQLPKSNMIDM